MMSVRSSAGVISETVLQDVRQIKKHAGKHRARMVTHFAKTADTMYARTAAGAMAQNVNTICVKMTKYAKRTIAARKKRFI
jgi:hypothetical protein